MNYEAVIGLEIHIQLNTQSKVFCACPADSWGKPPNTHICPVCTGQPGALPVLNEAVVAKAVRLAAAAHCQTIQAQSFFDRKNYFYPDLPKGYQITQYDQPIGRDGWFEVPSPTADGSLQRLTIDKLHLEEDAGKTKKDLSRGVRLIDMNRCGVPLIEMVTAPDLRSAEEAAQFLIKLRHVLRWLDVSDANMERAQMRCDANVSVRAVGTTGLNAKTEIKNVNSIEAVREAITKESQRQVQEYRAGRTVEPWTLDWDEDTQTLSKMRIKEGVADYRYFREPDLLPVEVDEAALAALIGGLPEMPEARRARFMADHHLPAYDVALLTEERALADYYETAVTAFGGEPKIIANWVQNEILRSAREQNVSTAALAFTPLHLAELVWLVEDKTITRQTAVGLMARVAETGRSPRTLVEADGLAQISGDEALRDLARQVIAENPGEAAAYRAKPSLLKWFVGQVMRKSKGKANAPLVEAILTELLGG